MKTKVAPQWQDLGTYKEPIPNTDNIRVPQIQLDDALTYIDKDGSGNMTFTDAVSGTKTLAQLIPTSISPSSTVTSETTFGISATAGIGTTYSRGDHTHGTPADPFISASAITLKPSGDIDDYFTFATVSNIPTIYGTGAYVRIGDAVTAGNLGTEDDLLVTGLLEVYGAIYNSGSYHCNDSRYIFLGDSNDVATRFATSDPNANEVVIYLPAGTATNVPVIVIGTIENDGINLGLNDGLTQALIQLIEKNGQLHSATDGIADAGAATAILKHVGGFTNAVAGDDVRITAGTLCTVGWYKIITVTSADQVTLDRNYTTGDTVNVTFVTYHSLTMLSAEGICTRTTYGAPTDASVEIDKDGWLIVRTGVSDLYWRANTIWDSVDTHIATHAALTTGIHGLAITAGQTLTVTSSVTLGTMAAETATNYVAKSLFDAYTVLMATSDDTPIALTVNEQTLVGRLTSGVISAVSIGIADNNMVQIDGADIADNEYARFTATGLESRTNAELYTELLGLTMAENDSLKLDPALSADTTWCGITEVATAGTTNLVYGYVYYLEPVTSEWELTNATAAATSSGKLGICVGAANHGAAGVILLWGKIRADDEFPALTVDAPVFLSAATAGIVTSTAPTGTTNFVVRIIGHANTADELFFHPDNMYVELA